VETKHRFLLRLSLPAAALLVSTGILALDLLVPLGIAIGVFYIVPIYMVSFARSIRLVVGTGLISSLFVILGWHLSTESGLIYQVIGNRFLSLLAIWIVCLSVIRFKILQAKQEIVHDELSDRIKETEKQRGVYVSLLEDIQSAKTLSEKAEERFRLVVEASPNAIIMIDKTGSITLVNHQAETLFGYIREELMGQKIEMLIPERYRAAHPGHRDHFFLDPKPRAMGAGRDLYGLKKDKQEVPIEIGLNPLETPDGIFTLASIINITERKSAVEMERKKKEELEQAYQLLKNVQAQLVQSEKIASLGRLSSGIAHEINSPLTGLLGLLKIYKKRVKEGTEQHQELGKMVEASEYISKIISDLNTFARQPSSEWTALDPAEVIESTLSFSAKELTDNRIKLNKRYSSGGPKVMGDRSQLQQVVLNLLTNARDAMPEGGELTIGLSQDKMRVCMEFTDTGEGMDADKLGKIFDPFFTTKSAGKGTGLGLSIVHGIVETHHGTITANSTPGKGTCFRVTLPTKEKG
jgi:PAS domain S-box-containing protein